MSSSINNNQNGNSNEYGPTSAMSPLVAEMQPVPKRMNLNNMQRSITTFVPPTVPTVVLKKQSMRRTMSSPVRSHHKTMNCCYDSTICDCGNQESQNQNLHANLSMDNQVNSSANNEWEVKKVEEVPFYFHIEKAHEYITGLEPIEISKRISDCFSGEQDKWNISYDNEKALARAEVNDRTKPNYCKMYVRLYKALDSPSILVECQRRTGCCLEFHNMAMKVLCAAKGCEPYENSAYECPHRTISRNILDQCQRDSFPVQYEDEDKDGDEGKDQEDVEEQSNEPECTCGKFYFTDNQWKRECNCIPGAN